MTVVVTQISLEDLKNYKIKNPAKFKHKFGELDPENVPEGFSIPLYKMMVVQERVNRDKYGISQDLPITPETFAPKAIPVAPVEAPRDIPVNSPISTEVIKDGEEIIATSKNIDGFDLGTKNVDGGNTLETKENI